MIRKCKWCGKLTNNKKFCSFNCAHIFWKKNKIGFFNSKIQKELNRRADKIHRLNKSGIYNPEIRLKGRRSCKENKKGFFDSNLQKILSKRADKIHRQNKSGVYNPKVQSLGGKEVQRLYPNLSRNNGRKSNLINKKNRTGLYNPEIRLKGRKASIIFQRKNKLGRFNSELQSKLGKKGGQKAIETLRKRYGHSWKGVKFMSNLEKECAKLILNKPIEGINCNIKVGTKRVDFYPQSYDRLYQGCFLEFHPLKIFNKNETIKSYYNSRRKVLDNNGFKNKKLIIITNLKEIK